ncbi:MAG: ATP-binding protein [Bacilli bacterium]|jgi:predicted AAA+ superfamily ATPase
MILKPKKYRKRIIDKKISENLKIFGALCIEGPKWCGKTWTALNHANSVIYIGNPERNFQNRTLASLDPLSVLKGEYPRLIDEWQEVPSLWDAVRFEVDKNAIRGQFILTGSSTPQHKGILHSGTGRIDKIKMRTMSLYESSDSSGDVSLIELFDNKVKTQQTKKVSLEELIEFVVRGGWPMSLGLSEEQYTKIPQSYIESIITDDLEKLDGIKREQKKIRALFKSLARNESTLASNKVLKNDILEFEKESISEDIIPVYLDLLDRMFLIENQPSFNPNYRSKDRVAKSPKRHFIDPSLAVAALGLSSKMLYNDLEFFGLLFESLVIRDLRIYADAHSGKVYHYKHFDTNHEIDAIVELQDGRWIAIEIKLGANQIDEAAKKLLKINESLKKDPKASRPCALVIICGLLDVTYKREDGVIVIPLTSLKP